MPDPFSSATLPSSIALILQARWDPFDKPKANSALHHGREFDSVRKVGYNQPIIEREAMLKRLC